MQQIFLRFIFEIKEGKILDKSMLDPQESSHGALAKILRNNGVNLLICGGIGAGAKDMLENAGINLIAGVSGDAEQSVLSYLSGNLQNNPEIECNHHDNEDDHSCTCR